MGDEKIEIAILQTCKQIYHEANPILLLADRIYDQRPRRHDGSTLRADWPSKPQVDKETKNPGVSQGSTLSVGRTSLSIS